MISDPRSNKEAMLSLLSPAMPKTPWEQMKEKHGAGESFLRMLGTGLSGGLLGNLLMPEMSKESKAQYATDMDLYKAQKAKMFELDLANQIKQQERDRLLGAQGEFHTAFTDGDVSNDPQAYMTAIAMGVDPKALEVAYGDDPMFERANAQQDTDIMRTTNAYVNSYNEDNPDNPISFYEGYDIVKNYDAGRRGAQAGAVAEAQSDVQQYTTSRDAYITAVEQDAVLGDRIANVDKGLKMLESGSVDTGPVVGFLASTFGMGSQELGELQQMSITEAMEALQMFKGTTTDFEFTKAELKSFAQIFTGEDLNIGTLRAARDSLEKVRKRNMLSGKSHLDAVREYGSDDQYNRLNSVFAQPEYWAGSRNQPSQGSGQDAPPDAPGAPSYTQFEKDAQARGITDPVMISAKYKELYGG